MGNLDIRRVTSHGNKTFGGKKKSFAEPKQTQTPLNCASSHSGVNFVHPDLITNAPQMPQANLDTAEYSYSSPHGFVHESIRYKSSKANWKRRTVFSALALVFALASVMGGRVVDFVHSISLSDQSFSTAVATSIGATFGSVIPALQSLDNTPLADAIRSNRTVNILLLGYGGTGHSGAYLTDSMMVLSVDFSTDKVTMIAIPRDTWVKIPTNGWEGSHWKINAAYEIGLDQDKFDNKLPQFTGAAGGGNIAKYVVSQVTGLQIDYFLAVDFSGFKTVVDDLKGVEVSVDNAFTDYTYPSGDDKADGPSCIGDDAFTNCRYIKVHVDAGNQWMDGERALEYVRSRHAAGAEGSDFARSKRQQKLIAAIQQKALSLDVVPKVFDLMDAVQGHFQTDLSIAEIKDLQNYAGKINLADARRISINDNGLLVSGRSEDGQYILTPSAGPNSWNAIHNYVFDSISGVTKDVSGMYGPRKPNQLN